jgi:hypothetical protein
MVRRPIYTKRLGVDVASKAKGRSGRYHVIPDQIDRWSVVADGIVKAVKAFSTKKDAVVYAKAIIDSNLMGEVIVHGMDGKILARISS